MSINFSTNLYGTNLYGTELYAGSTEVSAVSGEGGIISSGEIELEVGWNLIGIPVEFGYWNSTTNSLVHDGKTRAKIKNYVLDQIRSLMGGSVNQYIEICNTYVGDNQYFYNYVPGVTNTSSSHNFPLVYYDGTRKEVLGFWIKNIHTSSIVISWGE